MTDEVVGEQATSLFADAQEMLNQIVSEKWLTAKGILGIYPANQVNDDDIQVSDENGKELVQDGEETLSGNLCIKAPWPSILRTTYGDHERCRTNYFTTYENMYFTGDGALKDKNGFFRITGRVDDVLNVSGHRIGTAEVENAINMHSGVIESAVVGYPHEIKGQGIYAYIICLTMPENPLQLRAEIVETVATQIDIAIDAAKSPLFCPEFTTAPLLFGLSVP